MFGDIGGHDLVRQRHLNDFAANCFSQCGEDGILKELLSRLPQRDRWCVEFGAWDGKLYSNTAALVGDGYRRVLIEANPKRYKALVAAHDAEPTTIEICAMVGWRGDKTLDAILAGTPTPRDFDLLSVDIDGNDYHVWRAIEQYRPKVVVIEFNPTIRNGTEFVQPADPTVRQSSSITSMVQLGVSKDYRLVAATEYNAFFLDRSLADSIGLLERPLKEIRTDTSWQSEIFYGFDGTAMLRGGRGLEWHGLEQPTSVRLVPRIFHGFPGDFAMWRKAVLRAWAWSRRRQLRRYGPGRA
ncbi:MAG: FkbM family methyltransferase [Actinomycetota bacterium]|nr:FkbM family methyltransferase [Actinomycetota bacterium]